MSAEPRSALQALIDDWRAEAESLHRQHYSRSVGYAAGEFKNIHTPDGWRLLRCAADLEAVLASWPPDPPQPVIDPEGLRQVVEKLKRPRDWTSVDDCITELDELLRAAVSVPPPSQQDESRSPDGDGQLVSPGRRHPAGERSVAGSEPADSHSPTGVSVPPGAPPLRVGDFQVQHAPVAPCNRSVLHSASACRAWFLVAGAPTATAPPGDVPPPPRPCVIGQYCRRHGFIHGAEAEELRNYLAKLDDPLEFKNTDTAALPGDGPSETV